MTRSEEVRLVATIRLPSGNLAVPNHGTGDPARDADSAWQNGITEEEAFYLTKSPPYVEENRQFWVSGRDKLRSAFRLVGHEEVKPAPSSLNADPRDAVVEAARAWYALQESTTGAIPMQADLDEAEDQLKGAVADLRSNE